MKSASTFSWDFGQVIYKWLRTHLQDWLLQEDVADETAGEACNDALLLLNVGQSNRSSNLTYYEFDQFFDDGAAEIEVYCDVEY